MEMNYSAPNEIFRPQDTKRAIPARVIYGLEEEGFSRTSIERLNGEIRVNTHIGGYVRCNSSSHALYMRYRDILDYMLYELEIEFRDDETGELIDAINGDNFTPGRFLMNAIREKLYFVECPKYRGDDEIEPI